MKTTIFSRMIVIIAIAIMSSTVMFGQRSYVDVPAVPGAQLSKFTTGTAGEDPDLVTKGTKVPYLVYPDSVLSPTWAPGTDASNSTNLTSTFNWTIPGTISATAPGTTHYIQLDINGTAGATANIVVAETGAGCPGSSTTMAVKIVAQPIVTAAAVTDGTAPLVSICGSGINGSLAIPVPTYSITKTFDAAIGTTPNIKVHATLSFLAFGATIPSDIFTNQVLAVDPTTGNITLPGTVTAFQSWGTYTLTVLDISDKISRKDMNAAKGYFAPGSAITAVYTVLKTPTTGKIYHILNNNTL